MPTPTKIHTYVSANIDEQRRVWVRIIHQVSTTRLDQWIEIMLLKVSIKCIAWDLEESREQ